MRAEAALFIQFSVLANEGTIENRVRKTQRYTIAAIIEGRNTMSRHSQSDSANSRINHGKEKTYKVRAGSLRRGKSWNQAGGQRQMYAVPHNVRYAPADNGNSKEP